MSKKCKVEPCDFDCNDDKLVYHQPKVAKTLDDFAVKLEALLVSGKVHDTFDANLTFYNLKTAHGHRTSMSPLELGRAQGFLQAWNFIRGNKSAATPAQIKVVGQKPKHRSILTDEQIQKFQKILQDYPHQVYFGKEYGLSPDVISADQDSDF